MKGGKYKLNKDRWEKMGMCKNGDMGKIQKRKEGKKVYEGWKSKKKKDLWEEKREIKKQTNRGY